jgi:hypothetical protein
MSIAPSCIQRARTAGSGHRLVDMYLHRFPYHKLHECGNKSPRAKHRFLQTRNHLRRCLVQGILVTDPGASALGQNS